MVRKLVLFVTLGHFFGLVLGQAPCIRSFTGRVLDRETGLPLAFATVKVEGENLGAVTDLEGYFKIENLCIEEFNATFSFLGYKTSTHHHDSYHQEPEIYLSPDHFLLESVVVEGEAAELLHATVTSELARKELEELATSNFGEVVSQLAGVGVISNGQNIVRPVIHGLYGNRILIINNGIRHEYQSWGAEHAPEIDPGQAGEIRVIKGAATVHYGPDAMGGVLLVNAADLSLEKELNVKFGSAVHSNGRAYSSNIGLSQGFKSLAYSAEGSFVNQGDLQAPRYNLTNTGKKEFSYASGLKWHKKSLTIESRYSRFNQKLGILRGSVNGNLEDLVNAINADKPDPSGPFSYEINQPFQLVDHQVLLVKADYLLDNQSFSLKGAYQVNHREEYDVRRGTSNLTPNIDLKLATRSLDIDWVHPAWNLFSGEFGVQLQAQDNNNLPGTRTALFIPNFNYYRVGLFLFETLDAGKCKLEGGVRYDFHGTSARGIFQGGRYSNELNYQNVTYSVGLIRPLTKNTSFRFNLGSAWRPPNVAELYGFGRHQSVYEYGLWTYETDEFNNVFTATEVLTEAERKVEVEKAYKAIGSYELRTNTVQLEISVHTNFIRDYIYTKPAGITHTARGAFPYFIYDQTNALLFGSDVIGSMQHTDQWKSKISVSYLWARDITRSDFFVGLPPIDARYSLSYQAKFWKFDHVKADLGLDYFFTQFQSPRVITVGRLLEAGESGENLFANDTRNFDFLDAPEGYLLPRLALFIEEGHFTIGLQARNLLNKSYRSYTNRLRYYADEAGRDFSISLKWSL